MFLEWLGDSAMIRAGRRVIAQRDSRWLHDWNVLEEEMKFMSKTSALVFAGVTLGAMCTFGASAFPAASVDAKSPRDVILAAEGCGRGEHREHGRCQPDRPPHRVCPPGWHFSVARDRCVR
jgi:hypothetical protein